MPGFICCIKCFKERSITNLVNQSIQTTNRLFILFAGRTGGAAGSVGELSG
jgi:hypothetical protein